MPVTVQWDDDARTITCVHFEGAFTFPDIITAWEQEIALLSSVDYPVYSLNVFERVPFSVRGLNVRELHKFAAHNPPSNLQLTVQVTDNIMLRTALKTVMPTPAHELHIVATLDEAYAIINTHKATNA